MDGAKMRRIFLLSQLGKIHTVIDCVNVTKAQDPVSRRYDKIGTVKIYDHLAEQDV